MPNDSSDEELQLQAVLNASYADSRRPDMYPAAKQQHVPHARPMPEPMQGARQEKLKTSLAHTAGARQTPQVWRNSRIYTHLKVGTVPNDGNCFFHSIIQLAGARIARYLNIPLESLQPWHIRQHVASTVIDQMIECQKDAHVAAALMQSHPHLELMQMEPQDGALLDLSIPEYNSAFRQALGDDHADRCQHMSPAILTNLYHLARDRSWNNSTGDLFPPATAAAFPGLRIEVVTSESTQTFGAGRKKPKLLVLDGHSHYVPAKLRH